MIKHNLLNIESVFKGEQARGIGTSIATGFIANVLVYFGTNVLGLPVETSAAVFGVFIGNIIGYIADIMLAKQNFIIDGNKVVLPVTAFATRLKWLLHSFISKTFFRYWIIVFIDIIMTITIVGYLVKYFNQYQLFGHKFSHKFRDSLIIFVFMVGSFIIYINPLLFTWAYNETENDTMNMLILMWFTISLLIFVSIRNQSMQLQHLENNNIVHTVSNLDSNAKPDSNFKVNVSLPAESSNNTLFSNVPIKNTSIPEDLHGIDKYAQEYKNIK
jgi:hypothetical protein